MIQPGTKIWCVSNFFHDHNYTEKRWFSNEADARRFAGEKYVEICQGRDIEPYSSDEDERPDPFVATVELLNADGTVVDAISFMEMEEAYRFSMRFMTYLKEQGKRGNINFIPTNTLSKQEQHQKWVETWTEEDVVFDGLETELGPWLNAYEVPTTLDAWVTFMQTHAFGDDCGY